MSRVVNLPPSEIPFEDGAAPGGWYRETGEAPGHLVCELCPRECHLKPGDRGFCFVRENRDGQMALTTYGRSTGFCIDPIEKKPLNHFLPGTSVLSFGTAGCNLGCRFCQNWDISKSREVARLSEQATPETIANAAKRLECRSVAFTYNDPVIWAEYAIDVAKECRSLGVKTVAVTAGYIMPAARAPFFHGMDAANVDLKAFTEDFYFHQTASHLQPVLDTLVWLRHESDVWFEITNLIIPDANDSDDELRRMCDWIVEKLGRGVPVHFSAFHPDYRMQDRGPTPHETLLRAREIARACGIQFAYVGNVNDVKNQSTYCPQCDGLLIERNWYALGSYHLQQSACQHCGHPIAGRFESAPGDWGRKRQPVAIQQFAPVVRISPPQDSDSAGTRLLTIQPMQRNANVNESNTTSSTASSNAVSEQVSLTAEQQRAIQQATVELMEAAIAGDAPRLSDPTLAGSAKTVIQGIFTTIKRRGLLRGCCGTLGQPMALLDALRNAAARTATDDPRMPPLTGRELPLLDLDISILHSFLPMPADAPSRLAGVEVGRHGLRIQRGDKAGLLLPVVPVEHQWDAETFLRQVCRKAGLPSNAWEDSATKLVSFEAEVCEAKTESLKLSEAGKDEPFLSSKEMQLLKDHAQQNVVAHLTGATPNYYLMGCRDGTVHGIGLIVSFGPTSHSEGITREPIVLTNFSSRPGVPLQATLQTMTQAAAQQIGGSDDVGQIRTEVAIFTATAMHGLMVDPDLRGVDSKRHAMLVVERGKVGWTFDPTASPEQLVQQAAKRAKAKMPELSQVFSAVCATSAKSLMEGGTAPAARFRGEPRDTAVAGTFYPDNPESMNRTLDKLFGAPVEPQAMAAIMTPHAGWTYSGHIAADVFKRTKIPAQVLIIGPKHTRAGVEWAVSPHAAWRIPGGEVAANQAFARQLAERIPGWELDAAAHQKEHCVEVELPMLARLRPDVQVTGVALAGNDWRRAEETAKALANVLRELPELPLLVISSDMNHFAPDAENRRLDELALAAMRTGDGQRLLATCSQHSISMCGVFPAAIVMETLKLLGKSVEPQQLGYATSADVSGDTSRVVGYAGMLISG